MQRYWNRTSAWVFSCKFAAYFQNTFFKNTSGRLFWKFALLQKWKKETDFHPEYNFVNYDNVSERDKSQ